MAVLATDETRAFLDSMRERYLHQHVAEPEYDAVVYRARFLPDPEVLHLIVQMCGRRRSITSSEPPVPESLDARKEIAAILTPMRWPDTTPVARLGALLPGWDTLHVTTLMHAVIPDYPIWGPEESDALDALGLLCPYQDDPNHAEEPYRILNDAVKHLREAARYHQVPESHHYLTRVVQAALLDLALEEAGS
ncbi:MAG: hypothetical protein KY455_07185 [Euryarchaeota archaeon]|nr:hypothetical protein [Euryarchaeota archaeon]